MQIFAFDPPAHRPHFEDRGWVHIPQGVSGDFLELVRRQIAQFDADRALRREGITVAKDQFVFELPPEPDVLAEVFDMVAGVCGLARDALTLSERHVNLYAPDAEPNPRPHKDRFASQVSIGIPIEVPEGSHLVLWPGTALSPNPLQRAGLTDALPDDEAPEVVLREAPETAIFDRPGDVQLFYGSRIWHTRRRPAGAVVLYFKCNDFASDPLGEDPHTEAARDRSLDLLDAAPEAYRAARPVLSRRFEAVTREYALRAHEDWLNVHLFGRLPARITPQEFELLGSLDGTATVDEYLHGDDGADGALRRLVRLGAIDLLASS